MTTKEEGWLYKLSWTNLHRSWQRRYYVLQGKELRCYKKPDDHKPSSTIDLKHYVRVNMFPSKHSQWTFRLETGCRYHKSYLLCGETEADSRSWIHTIAARIHPEHSSQLCAPGEHHLKQYYQHHYNNHSNNSVDDDDGIDEEIISDYGSSVLDKWLERLDLQDDPSKKSMTSIATPMPSSTISTSIPTSTTSTAAGPLSTSLPALSSTISTTDETISRPPSSNSVSSNHNSGVGSSASAALADVFAQTRAAVKRRVTVSNGSQSPPPPPQPQSQPPLPRRSEDVFQFEEHESLEQHNHPSSSSSTITYSRTAMMIPPSKPPPTTALPPPPPPPRPK
ncbi:predicted protein [Lichtheimia corymbifera JMRC:FSU:9682]|uniref:PH domain-containing protein n=1 Tax=Lichtheimia corymbifera JMRC:FSU:9682 TaxID=1263082 RepID=A0A068RIY0_9FUNG|nr:predicted protein [Lichtheimia corymbifera JMRC:FSU:9682]